MEASNPEVLFDGDASDVKVKSLAEADRQIRNCKIDLLINGIDPVRIRPTRDSETDNEANRPKGAAAARIHRRGSALGLLALRPVWLMTPDVASRVLQPKPGIFDTVIFDEASQMPVEYALPTLFRSKIVVVSGDEKQMPPTSFFSSKVESDEAAIFEGEEPEDVASEEERDVFTETWNRREIKDCPDLLQLARRYYRQERFRSTIGPSIAS